MEPGFGHRRLFPEVVRCLCKGNPGMFPPPALIFRGFLRIA